MTGKSKQYLKHMLLESVTKQHIYVRIYRKMYVALFDQFVTTVKTLCVCRSVKS
jgi:hypothetical protein